MLRPAITLDEHRPPQHRAAARLSPEAVRETVAAIGGALSVLSDKIFLGADHPEQAARHVAGLIALGEKHGADVHSYAYVRALLASGAMGLTRHPASSGAGLHENLRGPAYYH